MERGFTRGEFNKTISNVILQVYLLAQRLKTIATVLNYTCKSIIELTSSFNSLEGKLNADFPINRPFAANNHMKQKPVL